MHQASVQRVVPGIVTVMMSAALVGAAEAPTDVVVERGYGWLGDVLPGFFFSIRPLEIELWQWCGMLVLLVLGWLLGRILTPALLGGLRRATRRTEAEWDDELVAALRAPLRLGILAVFLFLAVPWLRLSEGAVQALHLRDLWELAAILIIGWLLSRWIGVGAGLMEQAAAAQENQVARTFVPIFARMIKVVVWIVVVLACLGAVGVEVLGLVAGLGIGGLAFAFAAQRTIENLFGSFAIAADRPFEVGDFVTVGGMTGTVEEVGLRSTRIRTAARTVVTIPNGKVMAETVENYSARDRILFSPTIGLLYGSTSAQLSYVIDEVKKMLLEHPKVFPEVVRVRLDSFGDSAINISIFTWLSTTDFNEYTALKEELHFEIMRIVESAGTGFAFPSRTVYQAQEAGVDRARAEEIGAIVEKRRVAGELWIPEPPPPPPEAGEESE